MKHSILVLFIVLLVYGSADRATAQTSSISSTVFFIQEDQSLATMVKENKLSFHLSQSGTEQQVFQQRAEKYQQYFRLQSFDELSSVVYRVTFIHNTKEEQKVLYRLLTTSSIAEVKYQDKKYAIKEFFYSFIYHH